MSDSTRIYAGDGVEVLWNAERCIHSRECVRGLPGVFDPARRPWIAAKAAGADDLAAVVARCPSGALHTRRLDGGAEEPTPETVTVQTVPNGPLYVRGVVVVEDEAGGLFRRDTRVALCRCGQSQHKPFCDNSHIGAGFRAP